MLVSLERATRSHAVKALLAIAVASPNCARNGGSSSSSSSSSGGAKCGTSHPKPHEACQAGLPPVLVLAPH